MPVDLIVCGAGPAGLASAINAIGAGLEVAVLDPRPAPIDKACGEGIMPGAVRELERLGVAVLGTPFTGIRYLDGVRAAEARFRHGPGLGVRRIALQAALLGRLNDLGGSVQATRVDSVHQDERSVIAGGITGRYLIAADGLHSPVRRRLGLDAGDRGRAPRWGLRQHFGHAPWTDLVEVYWSGASEAYVTPVGPNLIGVAVLGGIRAPFATQLQAFPTLLERLPRSLTATDVRGAGPLRQHSRARVAGRVLLVGDAAGYVDALTGEGIAISLAGARAAVDCLRMDRPDRYEHRWLCLSRRYRVITEALLWTRHRPVLGRQITPMAARLPWAFRGLVEQLAR